MSRTGLWDSHAHLDDEAFNEDREQLIAQLEQDMDGIVNPGCDAASSAVAVELAKKYSGSDGPSFVNGVLAKLTE